MGFWRFVWHCLLEARKQAWDKAEAITGVVGVVVGVVLHFVPRWEAAVTHTLWSVPVVSLAFVVAFRLVMSPYWLYSELKRSVAKKDAEIEELTWPPDRPRLSFSCWGEVSNNGRSHAERGFHLLNDGGVALEIIVERFAVDQVFSASSATIARIGPHEEGFAPICI